MTAEDRLRGRLRSAASSMPVGSGSLAEVQARAAQLQRRRTAVRGGVGAFALVAVAAIGLVSLRGGGVDEYATSVAADAPADAERAPAAAAPVADALSDASLKSDVDADAGDESFETAGAGASAEMAAEEEMALPADDAATDERAHAAVFAAVVSAVAPPPGADAVEVQYSFSEGRALARVSDAWFAHDGTQWHAAEPSDAPLPEADRGGRRGSTAAVLHETTMLGVATSVEVSNGVAWLKHGKRVWVICPIPDMEQAHSEIGWIGEHVAIVVGTPEQSLYLLERID